MNKGVLAAVAAVGVIVAVGVVLDSRRRADPEYQQNLKMKRRQAKKEKERKVQEMKEAAEKKKSSKKTIAEIKADPELREKYFVDELQNGEIALNKGDIEAAIMHFVHAVSVHEHPKMIISQLATILPEQFIELILKCCDPEVFRDDYFDTFPGELTDKVEIKVVEGGEKERVVLAKCDIHEGEIIAEEDAVAAVFDPTVATSDMCAHCYKKVPGKPVQCKEKCGWETYCDVQCRDLAWEQQHRMFCSKKSQAAAKRLLTLAKETKDAEPLLVGRLLARAFPSDPKATIGDATKDIAHLHYRSPLPEPTDVHERAASELRSVMKDKIEIIDEVLPTPSYMALLSKVQQNKIEFHAVPESGEVTGHGIFLLGAFFNHSCEPNMKVKSVGGCKLAYVATREIKAGEEVCRSYIDVADKDAKERAVHLKDKYGFACECPQCHVVAPASGVTSQ